MVDAKGVAGAINIARSSGAADLDQAAIEAVRRWRFHPARQGGVAVASRVQVPVRFQLSRHDS